MTRDEFAAQALEIIKRERPLDASVFDEEAFSVVSVDPAGQSRTAFLHNMWTEYQAADTDEGREGVLRRIAHFAKVSDTEETFNELRPLFMPRIRPRAYFTNLLPTLQKGVGDKAKKKELRLPPYRVLAEHLALCLAVDYPDRVEYPTDLTKYPASFDELFDIALSNLKSKTAAQFGVVDGRLYISAFDDEFSPERMILKDLMLKIQVRGDPVVFIPNNKNLIVVGADDEEFLPHALALVDKFEEEPRFLVPMGFVLSDGEWKVFEGNTPPMRDEMSRRLTHYLAGDYSEQKQAAADDDDETRFFSTVMGLESGGKTYTMCSWTETQEALLPQTHLIAVVKLSTEIAMVRWRDFIEVCGHRASKVPDLYPPRWEVKDFVSEAEFAELKKREFVVEKKSEAHPSEPPPKSDPPLPPKPESSHPDTAIKSNSSVRVVVYLALLAVVLYLIARGCNLR
ncbi:MAG: hypothetical protein IPK82_43750 [Polyangiaceae bacterium]|nr:hypothetical protein [Polyangiaceae bacterium]